MEQVLSCEGWLTSAARWGHDAHTSKLDWKLSTSKIGMQSTAAVLGSLLVVLRIEKKAKQVAICYTWSRWPWSAGTVIADLFLLFCPAVCSPCFVCWQVPLQILPVVRSCGCDKRAPCTCSCMIYEATGQREGDEFVSECGHWMEGPCADLLIPCWCFVEGSLYRIYVAGS